MPKEVPLGAVTAETGGAVRKHHRIGLPAILAAFFWLGVTSFGGNTAAWLYYRIVQRRHWITDAEFLSGVALSRIMPGPGGVNLTVPGMIRPSATPARNCASVIQWRRCTIRW